MFIDKNIQYCQNVGSFQFDSQIQCNPDQNPSKLFYGYRETGSEVLWRDNRLRIFNTLMEEKKLEN